MRGTRDLIAVGLVPALLLALALVAALPASAEEPARPSSTGTTNATNAPKAQNAPATPPSPASPGAPPAAPQRDSAAAARDAKEKALRDARAMLRAGNPEPAINQLERLYTMYPDDPVVISALSAALIDNKRYDRAEVVLKQFVEKHPKDPKGLSDLANLYFTVDRKSDGEALLEKMIETAPEEAWPYQMAFLIYLNHNAPDDALKAVARARKATGEAGLLARDAARIYADQGKYEAAVDEYLIVGEAEGDAQAGIEGIAMMGLGADAAARRRIVGKLEASIAAGPAEEVARGALWQLRLADGDCAGALREIASLARVGKLSTDTVNRFAFRAQDKGCAAQCAEVYGLALGIPNNQAEIPGLLKSKAECELAGGLTDQAVATYGDLSRKYRNTKWAFDADVALAKIYKSQGRLDEAIAQADRVMEAAPSAGAAGADARCEAILFRGDCLIQAGRLEDAFTTYDLVATEWKPAYAQEAFYNLGEIKFYQGSFEDAVSYYNVTAREYADEPRANDALERMLLIKGVKGDLGTMWLKEFAQGELARRQGKTDEAAALFARRAAEDGKGLIKIASLRELAAIDAERGNLDGAIKIYRLVGDSIDNYYSPSALEAIGDVYAKAGKGPEAIQAYEDVILRFPKSVSAGDARRKIEDAKRAAQERPAQGADRAE